MSNKLIIKDAIRQITGRIISALCGFFVIKIITPYLWPLRYGDYSTILKYFAIWSALADFWLYVIAVKRLGQINNIKENKKKLQDLFWKFVGTRFFIMTIVYITALLLAYFLPAYTSNPYLVRWLPIGMIFSASFMTAGILQLPLQIKRKMEQVSIALILARIAQLSTLALTVFVIFPKINFDESAWSIIAFSLIILSVLISGITQSIYVRYKSNKLIKLKIKIDFWFIKKIISKNWKYGLSYYLSSFHTLIVIIFLSNFFPTSQWFNFTGIWWLWLALIEIMLIIPSALWNSLLHNVSNYNNKQKKKSFWNFFSLIFRIWGIIFVNFFLFKTELITLIWGTEYLGNNLSNPWSNTILPFLAIVLRLSFIKQTFNYIFVAAEKHNLLFKINLTWVIIWLWIWLYLIPKYNIIGGIITQVLLEVLFVWWAVFIALKHKLLPQPQIKKTILVTSIIFVSLAIWHFLKPIIQQWRIYFFSIAILLNIFMIWTSFPIIKKIAKGLTKEDKNK